MSTLTCEDAVNIEAQIPALKRYARSLTRDMDEADDIVQICLERAIRRFELFQHGTNLRSWLFTIMHNEFISGIRRRNRRGTSVPLDEWHDELSVTGRQEDAIHMRDLTRAFKSLPGRDREILYMVGVEGRSYENTAAMLNLRTGTVKSRLFRAHEKLRACLEGARPARLQAA
jgi:RNA polymerase sigma-70 factor (ECF subfamily)